MTAEEELVNAMSKSIDIDQFLINLGKKKRKKENNKAFKQNVDNNISNKNVTFSLPNKVHRAHFEDNSLQCDDSLRQIWLRIFSP